MKTKKIDPKVQVVYESFKKYHNNYEDIFEKIKKASMFMWATMHEENMEGFFNHPDNSIDVYKNRAMELVYEVVESLDKKYCVDFYGKYAQKLIEESDELVEGLSFIEACVKVAAFQFTQIYFNYIVLQEVPITSGVVRNVSKTYKIVSKYIFEIANKEFLDILEGVNVSTVHKEGA
jgi:hypothetical protein